MSIAAVLIIGSGCGMPDGSGEDAVAWKKFPIEYRIGEMIPITYHAPIQEAFEAWNHATGCRVFVFKGVKSLSGEQMAPDYTVGENVVLSTNLSGKIPTEGLAADPGPLARTFLYGATRVLDADVYLFEFEKYYVQGDPVTGDRYSVTSVVMHEAGHILFGPEHSDEPESIMSLPLYPTGHSLEKVRVSQNDIRTFSEVYGPKMDGLCETAGSLSESNEED